MRAAIDWMKRVLRRATPFAAGAGVLFVLIYLVAGRSEAARVWLVLGILLLCGVAGYYALKGMVWAWRRLLWRVRRRLAITYLFIGLTPIVLMSGLIAIAGFGITAEAMSRILTLPIDAYGRQALESARFAAAGAASEAPPNAGTVIPGSLVAQAASLQGSLPGARIALWCAEGGELGAAETPIVTSAVASVDEQGIGRDEIAAGAPVPGPVRALDRWRGVAFQPAPEEDPLGFRTPSIAGWARASGPRRSCAALVVAPLSRAMLRNISELTGIGARPYFIGGRFGALREGPASISFGDDPNDRRDARRKELRAKLQDQDAKKEFEKDQFGEAIPSPSYVTMTGATDWTTGELSQRPLFIFPWSWRAATSQILGSGPLGWIWRVLLLFVGGLFLALELVALTVAIWITRSVTGTVHELHEATQRIDRGDFTYRARPYSNDQLGALAASFNGMSEHIEALLRERVESERLKREVEIAAQVQAQLFPRSVPRLGTAEIVAECRAARGVAGDYYDFLDLAPGQALLALGDVSGKGISASLVMSNLQASLRAQTALLVRATDDSHRFVGARTATPLALPETDLSIATVTGKVNQQLCRTIDTNRFATLFMGLYDDRTRTLRYTNAGHNAAILVRPDGGVERLVPSGTIVGAFDWASYEERTASMEQGCILVVFSDGISEASNHEGEQYGEDRLVTFTAARRSMSAPDLRRAIFEEVDAWASGRERDDDQTLMVIRAL